MATKKKTEEAAVEAAAEEITEAAVEAAAEEATKAAVEETDSQVVKVKVLVKFRDKYTGKLYKPGEAIEVTETRFAEMNAGKTRVQKF